MTTSKWFIIVQWGIFFPVEETKKISLLRLKLAIRSTLILSGLTRK